MIFPIGQQISTKAQATIWARMNEIAAEYGWQKGAAANTDRSGFFSSVGNYKTEAEREAVPKDRGCL